MADYNSDRTGSNIDLTLDKVDALDAKVQPTAIGVDVKGDVSFYEDTGTTAKMVWDASAEQLAIGSNLNAVSPLTINASTANTGGAVAFFRQTGASDNGLVVDVTNTPSAYVADFRIGNSSKLRIDSTGNVGIGTASPSGKLHADVSGTADALVLSRDGGANGKLEIDFDSAFTNFNSATGGYTFSQNTNERARIDSSGNLLVGTTSPQNAKFKVGGGGHYAYVHGSADGISNWVGRTGSAGAGTETSLIIGSGDWYSGAEERAVLKLLPNHGSAGSNAGFSISSERSTTSSAAHATLNFRRAVRGTSVDDTSVATLDKDGGLWLNDGVYLGGTGAANKLDDYETGSWTPNVEGTSSVGTAAYTTRIARYVKVGNLVTATVRVAYNTLTGTGNLVITGLPFTASAYGVLYVGAVEFSGITYTGTPSALIGASDNKIKLEQYTSGGGATALPVDASGDIRINITYEVA